MNEFYSLKVKSILQYFKREHLSFWAICGYLFIEYFRPQSIFPALDFLPWASFFLVLSLLGWIVNPRRVWVSDPANFWIAGFFCAVLTASIFAHEPSVSFANLEKIYTWVIIYFLIINNVTSRQRFFIFIFIFLLASFKLSASLSLKWAGRGFSFTRWGLMGPPGFFQNSGELAIQMAVYWPIAYAMLLIIRKHLAPWKKYMMYAMPITAALVILGASSRGGQLALATQLIFYFWRQIFRVKVLLAILLACVVGWSLLPEEQKVRFTTIGEDKSSIQRMLYWNHGIDMLDDHPALGVGYFNFALYYERNFPHDVLYGTAQLPHNIFIQVGAELGYVGLFFYFGLMAYCFRTGYVLSWRTRSVGRGDASFEGELGRAMNVSFVGFLVAGQFVSVVYYPFMWIHLALLVCLKNTSLSRPNLKVQDGQR